MSHPYRGKRFFVPARLQFVCGGTVYRWGKPESPWDCRAEGSVTPGPRDELTELPRDWALHPEYGYLCPDCAAVQGAPRQLAGK